MSTSNPLLGKRERLKAKLLGRTISGFGQPPPVANAQTTLTTNLTQDPPTPSPSQISVSSVTATPNHEPGEHRDLWAVALQRLPEKDQEGLLVTDQTAQNNVLEQLFSEVRQQQRDFEADAFRFNFRGRQIVPRDIADRALTLLDKFKEIGDVAVNFDPVHAALPWAGVRFLLQIAVSEKKQRCELMLGIEKVLSMTGRYRILEKLYLRQKDLSQGQMDLQTALVATYTLILKYLLQVKHLQSKASIARGSWALFHHDELCAFFKAAEQYESSIDRAASICESSRAYEDRGTSVEIRKHVEGLQSLLQNFKDPLQRIQLGVSHIYEQIEQSKQSEILRWISPIAFEDDHYTARRDRAVDSGQWLLQDNRFQDWWQSESSSIMWLHGLPGAGKTKLVSSIVDLANPNHDDHSSVDLGVELTYHQADSAVAYFYCDRNREDHRDPRSILCSFVRQLSMSKDGKSLHSHAVATYEKNKASGFATSQLSYEKALAHLEFLAQAPSQTILILDALDECEESTRIRLVQDLQALLQRCNHPIRIFISSRPNQDIKAELHEGLNRAIEATDNRHDICRYVDDTITKPDSPAFWRSKLPSHLRQRVFETLTQNAEGNFQWVDLQIKQLHSLSSVRDVESRLGKLPKTLKALYDEMYCEILDAEGCGSLIAERAFKWLMCSYESMSPKALVDAVCQDPFTDAMNDVDDIDIDFVLHACQNLITVTSSGKVCRFSHLSIQEFLENHRFRHREAHELVATICLKRLTCLEASSLRKWSKLYKYAAMHWTLHVQRSCELGPGHPRLLSLLQRFLGSKEGTSPQYRLWLEDVDVAREDTREFSIGPGASGHARVYYYLSESLNPSGHVSLPLAFFSLHHILPDLWRSIDIFDCNDSGMTLLALAAQGGHISTVETLIRAGVDVNSFDSGMGARTALYNAIVSGSISITEMLLAAGADVNFCAPHRDRYGILSGQSCSNALQIAAFDGPDSIFDLLLQAGAQVNLRGGEYGTALQAASNSGNEATVKKLLDAGAEINAQGGDYGTALQAASRLGHKTVVKLLLSAGAEVNAPGGEDGNALQVAASSIFSLEATVELLLEAGADVNAQGGEYGNALQAASFQGKKALVMMLLSAGADVNAQGGAYGNALNAAIAMRHTNLAKTLLAEGADVNAQGGPYGNALELAASNCDKQIVQLLLDGGADIERIGRFGKPLSAAFVGGAFKIVRSFLATGCDMSTLEVDIEQWLELGPGLYSNYYATQAVQRIFRRRSRAIPEILRTANEWLEDNANDCHPAPIGSEDNERQMQSYIERGCIHLKKMMEAEGWEEDEFDEGSSTDSYCGTDSSDLRSDLRSDGDSD